MCLEVAVLVSILSVIKLLLAAKNCQFTFLFTNVFDKKTPLKPRIQISQYFSCKLTILFKRIIAQNGDLGEWIKEIHCATAILMVENFCLRDIMRTSESVL